MQDSYDLLTGKTRADQIKQLASKEGPKKVERLKRPLLSRKSLPGSMLPTYVLDVVDTVYFNLKKPVETSAPASTSKSSLATFGNQTVATLKELAPEKIESIFQLFIALTIFFWILVITKLVKIQGQLVVDVPRLSGEMKTLKEME